MSQTPRRIVRAVASPHLTQTHTYFHGLLGGVVARMFLSHQRTDPIPSYHTHEGEQVIVAVEGESRLEILREHGTPKAHAVTLPMREGDIAVLSAGRPHRWITPHGELLALAIDLCEPGAPARERNPQRDDFEAVVRAIFEPREPEVVQQVLKGDDAFPRLIAAYRNEAELQRPGYKTSVSALCAQILVRLARLRANAQPMTRKLDAGHAAQAGAVAPLVPMRLTPAHYVERAREFLHADYRRPIALPELAERVGLSVTHLHRLFVGQLRQAPMTYLRQYRLKRAGEMLAQTARPVREIAREVGFPEPERFTKAFRRTFGCSPRDYRKQALKAEPALL